MKLSEFILLSAQEKKETVLHQGVLIAKRIACGNLVFLFQLENYYVETFCNRESREIGEYRAFSGVHALSPYLDSITIDHLLQ